MAESTHAGSGPASVPEGAAASGGTPTAGAGQVGTPAAGPSVAELLAAARAEWAAELKAATGHDSPGALAAAKQAAEAAALAEQGRYRELHDASSAELARTKATLDAIRVQAAVVAAARASVDPEVVHALLNPRADIDAAGRVTIGGKDPVDAVADLLKQKPWLAAPAGGQGSGAGASGPGAPAPAQMTMAQLGELRGRDPAAYSAEIKRRAAAGGAR